MLLSPLFFEGSFSSASNETKYYQQNGQLKNKTDYKYFKKKLKFLLFIKHFTTFAMYFNCTSKINHII